MKGVEEFKLLTEEIIIDLIRTYFISICTYYMNFKIINSKEKIEFKRIIVMLMGILITTTISEILKVKFSFPYITIWIGLLISILFAVTTKNDLAYSMLITTVSLSVNYIIFSIGIFGSFFVNIITNIKNEYINLSIIIIIYLILFFNFIKIKRFKQGLSFLQRKLENEYFNILILNISITIILTIIILINSSLLEARVFGAALVIASIIMFITIQKSLQIYYKQKLLIKDLNETKKELEEKNKEIEKLEKENLNFSKISHSIAHKQKSLEYKLEQLAMNSEIANEIGIKDRINNITKDFQKETALELSKTGIEEIDDMLKYMQAECIKNKIDFQLQINGNIHKMINNHIEKKSLEILLADHIKNAIIAISSGNNINKSILVRLGIIDGNYGLYIYDSGIEFEIKTLLNLGRKPATTHKDTGGTGMGFMNTFDTLRKYKASLEICEYGKPCKDNFTKVLKIKFDKKNEFSIISYRAEKIEKLDKQNLIKVEKLI